MTVETEIKNIQKMPHYKPSDDLTTSHNGIQLVKGINE